MHFLFKSNHRWIKKFKANGKNLLSNSSGHGFPNPVSKKFRLIKSIWAISILNSICGCFIFIFTGLFEYFQYDFITNIKNRYEYSLDYPSVLSEVNLT